MLRNIGGVSGAFGLAVIRQLMLRGPTIGLVALLVVGGSLIGWLYVAEAAKNLETSQAAATVGTEQASAVHQSDRAEAKKLAADLASAIAALKQGLQELAAGLEQVKQGLQQEHDRTDKETHRLAADQAQTQQLAQRESEQARHLAQGLATNLASELATNIDQVRQALQQQSDRIEKLALESPMRPPKRDAAAPEQEGQRDGRLNAVISDVAQLRQAIGALAADVDKVRQALPQESERSERKVAQLATELGEAKQSAQRAREGADRRGQELTADLAQLKEALQRETDRNEKLTRQLSADVAQIKDALRHESEQKVQTADELRAGLAQLKLAVHQLTADLAANRVEVKQRWPLSVAKQSQMPGTLEGPKTAPGPERELPSREPEKLVATRSDAMAEGDANGSARPRENVKFPSSPPSGRDPAAHASTDAGDTELQRLMSRANLLISQGDIGGARIVLERAAETGNARALFALAETFDPVVLAAWGTLGTRGDETRAQELYAKALAGGVDEAKRRLTR